MKKPCALYSHLMKDGKSIQHGGVPLAYQLNAGLKNHPPQGQDVENAAHFFELPQNYAGGILAVVKH